MPVEDVVVERPAPGDEVPPRCPACGGMLRPDVVWFGEAIPEQALERSFAAAQDCDVFLSIGTSSLVYPAAGLAELDVLACFAERAEALRLTQPEISAEPCIEIEGGRHIVVEQVIDAPAASVVCGQVTVTPWSSVTPTSVSGTLPQLLTS